MNAMPPELQRLLEDYRSGRVRLAEFERELVNWGLRHPEAAEWIDRLMDQANERKGETDRGDAEATRLRPSALEPHPPGSVGSPPQTGSAPHGGAAMTAVPQQPSQPRSVDAAGPASSNEETLVAPPPSPPREPRVGDVLKGRFVLEERIGRGGMGTVFKARDRRREEARDRDPYVAIKVLGGDLRNHPDAFIALQREAKKAQKLAHPNTVTVYDFDRDGDIVFMTMELLDGQSLAEVLRSHPQGLPLDQALPIIRGIVEGLDYAHHQGIVHADLKPGNVFITRDGVVKVLDFGIARALRKPSAPAQDATVFDPAALGALTPAYASAEMIEGAPPDPRDDVYALACLTYELLTGRHPFGRLSAVQARDQGLRPKPVPGLPRRRWRALLHGLDQRREKRTPDVRTFYAELAGRRTARIGWLATLTVSLAALALAAYFFLRPAPAPQRPPPDPAKLAELLELADLQRQMGRLLAPPGSNAYDAYRKVLEMDPDNTRAREGMRKISTLLASEATRLYSTDQVTEARRLVDEALRYFPNDEALLRLRDRMSGSPQ